MRQRELACASLLPLVAAAAGAQAPVTPKLVTTGRVFARGDGEVARCLITADSSRALTVGAEHDLVWWNLRERRPLRHIDPPDAPIRRLLLHPAEPWLVCVLDDGTGVRIDLTTGARGPWTAEQVAGLQPPRDGNWLSDGVPTDRAAAVVSANGRYRLVLMANGRLRRDPPAAGQFFFGERHWIANDGTVVETKGATLRLRGLAFDDLTDACVHCGPPQRLVFTPDGGHLAIVSLAATQIVDIAGNEIARLEGLRIVQPGPGPDEFWLLTADAMRRWSATRRNPVGDAITWPGRNLRLVVDRWPGGEELRQVLVRGGQPWTPEFVRLPDGTFRALAFAPPPSPAPRNSMEQYAWMEPETAFAFLAASATAPPMLLTSARAIKFSRDRATLRRLGDDGATTHHATFDAAALWLALGANGTHVYVGLANGTVQGFDARDLTPLAKASFAPPLVAAVALDPGHLLASTGGKLLRLDAATLAVVDELPLPEGLAGADQLARSADGTRLAIARGSEVRVVRIE